MKQLFRYLLAPLCCIAIENAFAQAETTITGSFAGADEKDLIYITSNYGLIDSAYIHNKRFEFSLCTDSSWDAYFVRWTSKTYYAFPLFLKQGSRINFEVNKELDGFTISGDKNAEEQQAFYQGLFAIDSLLKPIRKKIATTSDSAALVLLNRQLEEVAHSSSSAYVTNWLSKHKDSPFSVAALRLYLYNESIDEVDTVAEKYFDLLSEKAKENNYQTELLRSSFAHVNERYSLVDHAAPDFNVRDTSGNVIELSQFKNKFLLIDFWASWCGPCRANNPFLKSIYERYKHKGLELLSISIDTDSIKWKTAIQKDELNWLHGSELSGGDGKAARSYLVRAVPTYLLISPDGKVLFNKCGGDFDMLERKLKEILR